MSSNTPSPRVRANLVKLGEDISIARRRRAFTQARLAEGAGIDVTTLRKLERGNASVSLGALAMVLLVLGESDCLGQLLDSANDDLGIALSIQSLPKRVRTPLRQISVRGEGESQPEWDNGVF